MQNIKFSIFFKKKISMLLQIKMSIKNISLYQLSFHYTILTNNHKSHGENMIWSKKFFSKIDSISIDGSNCHTWFDQLANSKVVWS